MLKKDKILLGYVCHFTAAPAVLPASAPVGVPVGSWIFTNEPSSSAPAAARGELDN